MDLRAIGFATLWLLVLGGLAQANEPATIPQVLYLHTEFLPYAKVDKKDLPYRMGRELVRQAFLVAARDELGVATRDETLGELPPTEGQVIHLILSERANSNGRWGVKLYRHSDQTDWRETEPVWEKTYKYKPAGTQMYREMQKKLEKDSREEFVKALETAGLRRVERALLEAAPRDSEAAEELEKLLRSVDFLSQYGAVRATHQRIAEQGETPEQLGQLARGYAHLSLLTMHHWNASSEAFAGRAIAYAQRVVSRSGETPLALHHRAYVWAITGSMHFALDDLKKIKKLREEEGESGEVLPSWTRLTGPYARCDRDALKRLADEEQKLGDEETDSLRAWATHLDFQVALAYRYPRWIYAAALPAAELTPGAINVYASLAQHGGSLRGQRTGAYYAPHYFGQQLPIRMDRIADLPRSVRGMLPLDVVRQGLQGVTIKDPNPQDVFSPLPSHLARELRKESAGDGSRGMSWSALAALVEEEQFVGAANYFLVSTNATERSLADEVDGVLPLIQGHRYAPYVEAYRYNVRRDREKVNEVLADLELRDVRPSMAQAMMRFVGITNRDGEELRRVALFAGMRNFTMYGMLEFCYRGSNESWQPPPAGAMLARELSKVAPRLEVGLRMTIQITTDPSIKDLDKWQEKVKIDSDAIAMIGHHYYRLEQYAQAVQCFERALEMNPTVRTALQLANIHNQRKDYDKWENVLLDYLKTESQGLDHSLIQNALARGLASRGQWAKAKPYAEAAAQTYSSNGLAMAAYVCEGLGHWEESEQWMRRRAEAYPSGIGDSWYLWCCRTGRGDREAALKFAEPIVEQFAKSPSADYLENAGGFYLLQGDLPRAHDAFARSLESRRTFPNSLMLIQLSIALDDTNTSDKTIALLRKHIEEHREKSGEMHPTHDTVLAILDLIESQEATPERLAAIESSLLASTQSKLRTAFCYLVGAELAALGHDDEAVKYWRRSINTFDRDITFSTLAGHELAMRFGTSRPEEDMLDEDDVWPPLEDR